MFYLLLASPMLGGRFHDMEDSWSTPSWSNWTPESMNWSPESWSHWNTESSMYPSHFESMTPFNWSPEYSNWNTESMTPFSYESTFPSTHFLNSILRKAIRASTSRRSIVRELTGMETPFEAVTPVERMLSKVHLIRRIAEVNPIMIEKILSCPETRFAVETILRHAEPETLLLVEKLIRKNIPSYLIKDVTRRIAKNLIHSSKYSKYSKRSIISELYPTSELFHSYESPIFSNDFESIFSTRSAKKDSIRRLIKSVAGVYEPESELFSEESVFSPLSSKKNSIRRLIKSIAKPESELFSEESVFSPLSSKKNSIRRLVKSVAGEYEPESKIFKSIVSKPEKNILKKLIKKVLRHETPYNRVHFCTVCENVCESHSTLYTVALPVCHICNEVCHTETLSTVVSPKMIKKSIRKLVKNVKHFDFDFEKTHETVNFCHFCNTVCDDSTSYSTLYAVSPVCRKCNVVCHGEESYNNVFSKLF